MTTYLFNKGYIYPIGNIECFAKINAIREFWRNRVISNINNVNIPCRYFHTMIFLI